MNIEICHTCKGEGEIRTDVVYHNSEYVWNKCTTCNGTGRVLTRSYKLIIPFGADKTEYYKADSSIIQIIRNIEKQ